MFAKGAHDPAISASNQSLVDRLEDETVALVHFMDEDGKEVAPDDEKAKGMGAYCTGVWLTDDTFLTAEHCVDDIGRPKADDDALQQLLQSLEETTGVPTWTPQGQPVLFSLHGDVTPDHKFYHSGKVAAVDMYDDMVLVKTDEKLKHQSAALSRNVIHDGDDVHIVGHTVGMWWSYMRGYVSAHRPTYEDDKGHKHDMLQISAPAFFGDSGGGAFDADGNLIGMCDSIKGWRHGVVPNVAFYVHRDAIKGFLEHEKVLVPQR
jgi:hypothetical protein